MTHSHDWKEWNSTELPRVMRWVKENDFLLEQCETCCSYRLLNPRLNQDAPFTEYDEETLKRGEEILKLNNIGRNEPDISSKLNEVTRT